MSRREPTVQGRVRELLCSSAFGRGVGRVRMLQTHTSWVFLTGRRAYKIKKPVNFGFLDYTTLAARRFFCQEELRLNRQLSPDIYLGVRPVVESRGRLRLGARGRAVDHAVEMIELPQDSIMTERLRRGEVTLQHVEEIARAIASFHAQAERGREVSQYGSLETIRLNWDENFAQTLEFRGRTIDRPAFDRIRTAVERFMRSNWRLLRRRRTAGRVCRCHGDLHSRNVFIDGRVHVFDCIEFNPRFSCSDVASEVAFMAMDLEYWGRKDLSNFFVERYIVHSSDADLLRVLGFYKCYRAYVRGKVTSFNLNDPGMSAGEKAEARAAARRYFRLAGRYAAGLDEPPRWVVMFGLPGTGKTWLGRKVAERLDALHLMTDSVRKQILGLPVGTDGAADYGRGIYAPDVSRRTYRELLRRARSCARAGQAVVLDGTFLHEDYRQEVRDIARRLKLPVLFVWTDCPEWTVVGRIRRRGRERSLSDADVRVYRSMKGRFVRPRVGADLVRVDTRQPVGRSLAKIERALLHI